MSNANLSLRSFWRQQIWQAAWDSPALRALLTQLAPETLPSGAQILKAGDTTTVYQVFCAGQKLVVKRYNLKHWRYALKRALLPSRAGKSWRNAQLLQRLGLSTPVPVAWVEDRWGLLRRTSYFIYQHQEGMDAETYFHAKSVGWQAQAAAVTLLLQRLGQQRLRHGDLKATNILLMPTGPTLLDLDALRVCRLQPARCQAKDRARWLENWQDEPELLTVFSQLWVETGQP